MAETARGYTYSWSAWSLAAVVVIVMVAVVVMVVVLMVMVVAIVNNILTSALCSFQFSARRRPQGVAQ